MIFPKIILAVATLISAHVSAHVEQLSTEHKKYVARSAEAMGSCLESRDLKDFHAQIAAQRSETVQHIRKARGIDLSSYDKRDPKNEQVKQWASSSHEQDINNPVWATKNDEYLFGFDHNKEPNAQQGTCILTPESIYGPYWHEGQTERQDVRAGQPGIYMRLSLQVIDLETCKPIEDAHVDLWHANATGQYSPKAGDWLRGYQLTTNWGTADFDTIFPGHYPGRATHLHVAVREKGQKRVLHTGQIYFDEWPRMWVESTDAYRFNDASLTKNVDDDFISEAATDKYDPFAKWAWLGHHYPNDGLISWIVIGVNRSAEVGQPDNQKRDSGLFDTQL